MVFWARLAPVASSGPFTLVVCRKNSVAFWLTKEMLTVPVPGSASQGVPWANEAKAAHRHRTSPEADQQRSREQTTIVDHVVGTFLWAKLR